MNTPHSRPQLVQLHRTDEAAVRAELVAGLLQSPAQIAPKFFYDPLGSRLFEAITELPEYYPTRTESAIFAHHMTDMARQLPAQAVLVDLGAGNCAKAARLFEPLQTAAYVAVDISVDFLDEALQSLHERHPSLPMLGLGLDFSQTLTLGSQAKAWLGEQGADQRARVVFYPGSSIGNFVPADALALLRQVHGVCAAGGPGGGILIGVDRTKPVSLLEAAYDDALGVTAAFNRNLLRHVNRWLQADFDPAQWQHIALWNAAASRIEMHLQARSEQRLRWPGGERLFTPGERIHTENACKWTPPDFEELLRQAGFGPATHWSDERGWFSVFWAPALPPG